jgi:NADH:ubiquinone oxidoreductase subunit 3 (subunit A)
MSTILLAPPVAFLLYLGLSGLISLLSKRLAATGKDSPGKNKSYACGEDMLVNRAQPDYSQFFQFAFFFTIMHVVVLVVATDPAGISLTSGLYLTVTVLVLFMLFRR